MSQVHASGMRGSPTSATGGPTVDVMIEMDEMGRSPFQPVGNPQSRRVDRPRAGAITSTRLTSRSCFYPGASISWSASAHPLRGDTGSRSYRGEASAFSGTSSNLASTMKQPAVDPRSHATSHHDGNCSQGNDVPGPSVWRPRLASPVSRAMRGVGSTRTVRCPRSLPNEPRHQRAVGCRLATRSRRGSTQRARCAIRPRGGLGRPSRDTRRR